MPIVEDQLLFPKLDNYVKLIKSGVDQKTLDALLIEVSEDSKQEGFEEGWNACWCQANMDL